MYLIDDMRTEIQSAIYEPGNGTRFVVVWGYVGEQPFVAIPNLGRTAEMGLRPVEWRYVAKKLSLGESDAKAVWNLLAGPDAEHYDVRGF